MKKSYSIAGAITLLIAAWIFSGQLWPSMTQASQPGQAAVPVRPEYVKVRGRVSRAREHVTDIVLRGRTQALRTVELKAETDGRVVELPVEKGDEVKAGQVICRLAVDDREARLAQAQALVRQRKLERDISVQLAAEGHRAETKVAAARALYDAAKAQATQMEVELGHVLIVAPFEGIIDARPTEIGDYLQKGQNCATIVDQDPFLVVGEISERDVNAVAPGNHGRVRLLDGTEIDGVVRFLASTANPATRTFRIELEVANADHRLRDGLTAEIRIGTQTVPAHFISPALLVLDDSGAIGVKIVDGDDIVRFKTVDIISDGPDGMWVAGLPGEATIITVGQEYVRDGDRVEVSLKDPPTRS